MTPNELCQAYRNELRRLYGDQVADASRVDHTRGWYYIGLARRVQMVAYGVEVLTPTVRNR